MAETTLYRYEMGFSSHKGTEKDLNEDNYFAEHRIDKTGSDIGVVALSDGLGGFSLGEIASKVTVNQVEKFYQQGELAQMFEEAEFLEPPRVIQELYTRINHVVMSLKEEENRSVGSTLVTGFLKGNNVYVANVGNTRGYLIRGGSLKVITREKGEEAPGDKPSQEGEPGALDKYVNSLGSKLSLKADVAYVEAKDGDILLFCTDGLYNQIDEMEMVNTALISPSMQDLCDSLVVKANKSGKDNVTVVAIQINLNQNPLDEMINRIPLGTTSRTAKLAILFGIPLLLLFLFGMYMFGNQIIKNRNHPDTPRTPVVRTKIYNSLTMETEIPIEYIVLNKETRSFTEKSWTFPFNSNENELTIMPNCARLNPQMYAIIIRGANRNLTVEQAKTNVVTIAPDSVKVNLTVGSKLDYNIQPDYRGDNFVLRINNLASPTTVKMENQENILVQIGPHREEPLPSPTTSRNRSEESPVISKPGGEI